MDQLRSMLSWLKRQHFWVLSGVVALVGLFCWWSAARTLAKKYDDNQKTIKNEFTALDTLRKAPFHANQTINDKQTEEKNKQAESVKKLWQELYDRQRAEVLKWPDALNKTFRDTVEKMDFNADIPWELRSHYQNYILNHFPELPKQINARPLDPGVAGGGVGGEFGGAGRGGFGSREGGVGGFTASNLPLDDDYICEWSEADQAIIREQLLIQQQPSPLRIWVTQEDLWVYHTLLNVIAKTNRAANATRQSNAAVKTVYSLEVGRPAAGYSRQPNRLAVPPPQASAVGPGAGGEGTPAGPPSGTDESSSRGPEMMPGGRQSPMGDGRGGGGPMSPAEEQGYLLSYRYLDDKGQPIPIGGGGAVSEPGAEPDPAAATADAQPLDTAQFGVGYKRLPVRMALLMDARWLPQLITACANEPLRVEVQEVRINTPDLAGLEAGGGGGGARMGGFGGGFRGEGSGPRGGMGGGAGGSLFPELTGVQNFPSQPHVVNVAIQGTIYIFNKPNMNLLQSQSETGQMASQ